jgi:hypothetical protein
MSKAFGPNILKYVGRESQLFGTREYTLTSGRAEGVKAIDVKNGDGLEFTILTSKGMDISQLSFRGINFSYLSDVGISSPYYYNDDDFEFTRNWHAGFLTTCGLRHTGFPSTENKEAFGLHGRVSNIPAEEVYAGTDWENGEAFMTIKGKVREVRFQGENILLEREIVCKAGENKISIRDKITNLGFDTQPLMILYHMNMGYPLLDASSYFLSTSKGMTPLFPAGEQDKANYLKCHEPIPNYEQQAYFHDNLYSKQDGKSYIALINEGIGKGVVVKFDRKQLNWLLQWKHLKEREYAVGLEPANCRPNVGDRKEIVDSGDMQYIKPGETKRFELEVVILENLEGIRSFIKS